MNLLSSLNSAINYDIDFRQIGNNNIIDYSYKLFMINRTNKVSDFNTQYTDFAHKKLISRGFWGKLVNSYWQETIFLSKSDTMSEKYINQLKSDGLSIYGNQYKKFLFNFSKALMIGRINTSLNKFSEMDPVINNSPDIKYVWHKGFNFFVNKRNFELDQNDYMNKTNISLTKKLKYCKLPLFTVTNNLNQIVIAEPADNLLSNYSPLDSIYKWYYNHIFYSQDPMPVYEALFFINSEDALEYKQNIVNRYLNYNIYSGEEKLKILSSGLDSYYKLVYKTHPKIYFRLIPDLKELGELIYKYQYNKNVVFHRKQQYGKDYFQGQPIYIIEPVYCNNNVTKTNDLVTYQYEFNKDTTSAPSVYKTVFMNYKVALLAWRQFVANHKHYNLPNQPQILVYNLENFLKDYIENDNWSKIDASILFVPNKDSYRFLKSSQQEIYRSKMQSNLYNKLLHCKMITKRLIWSLTSKQPINL